MSCIILWLCIIALSAVSCQAEVYLRSDGSSDMGMTLKDNLRKTSRIRGCDSRNVTLVTPSTSASDMHNSIGGKWLTTTTTAPMHCDTPSSSNRYHDPRETDPIVGQCMPPVVPVRSSANKSLEDLMSSLIPGLIVGFPNHTVVVHFYQVGFAPRLHSFTTDSTTSPTTNVTASTTGKSKPLSFADFIDTLSNIVSIVTSCIQTWFQFRNPGELRGLLLPRLAPLQYLIHLRNLPVLAIIAQGRANPAEAVARPAPVARLR